jgi:hypothetical protein
VAVSDTASITTFSDITMPLLRYTDPIGTAGNIPLASRSVNIMGNSLPAASLYLQERADSNIIEISTYPQRDDLCAISRHTVSRDFPNPIWFSFLMNRFHAPNTAANMCGGKICDNGVKQLVAAEYHFCQPKTLYCTYPCLEPRGNITLDTSEALLIWYVYFLIFLLTEVFSF